jgi:SM-20-related protein
MTSIISLFELNPALDLDALNSEFAQNTRIQIRDFLTPEAASTITDILARQTPWGLAWQAEQSGPKSVRANELQQWKQPDWQRLSAGMAKTMQSNGYGFLFGQYPMLDAYLGKWDAGGPHDLLLEHLNSEPFLNCVRKVTGIPALIKADAQATHYAANNFLSVHNDSHRAEGWRIAYVLNMCPIDWRPEWGGYLLFHDEDGDVIKGYKPRFNSLNLFMVPQLHSVSFVPPFAPNGRLAITGWLRDQ